MKCYLDITLQPSVDIPLYFLWEKLYQQLHLAFVEIQDSSNKVNVGVAFPGYEKEQHQLGCKLRLLAPSQKYLEDLKLQEWLSRLSDYIHITNIRDVPEKIQGYAFFKRIQPKSNNARLARRKAKREGISYEQALSFFEDRKEQYSIAPFIRVKSHSTGKRYRLMITRIETENNQTAEGFSTYGLSAGNSVPLF